MSHAQCAHVPKQLSKPETTHQTREEKSDSQSDSNFKKNQKVSQCRFDTARLSNYKLSL